MELAAVAGPSTGNKSLGDLLRCLFITFCFCVFQVHLRSVAEPEPPGAATFRVELEAIFLFAGSGCIFLSSKKEKPTCCD